MKAQITNIFLIVAFLSSVSCTKSQNQAGSQANKHTSNGSFMLEESPSSPPNSQSPESSPTSDPSMSPTTTPMVTDSPTAAPTESQTASPTETPSESPTASPAMSSELKAFLKYMNEQPAADVTYNVSGNKLVVRIATNSQHSFFYKADEIAIVMDALKKKGAKQDITLLIP